jgi:hypothetical protein
VTSPYKWKILERDVSNQSINQNYFDLYLSRRKQHIKFQLNIFFQCEGEKSPIYQISNEYLQARTKTSGITELPDGRTECKPKVSFDWLIDYLLTVLHVPLKKFSLKWRRHHYRWGAVKFRPMLGDRGLWAGRDLYRATPTVTRGLGFSRSHPKDRPIQSPFTTHMGMWRMYSNLDPHRSPFSLSTRKGMLRTYSYPNPHGLSLLRPRR